MLGNKRLHVMAGVIRPDQDRARHREAYLSNLALAASKAAPLGITIVIEPLNPRDAPGFFLTRQDDAHAVCADVGAANLMVQMDFYHCQIVEGDLAVKLRKHVANVGHIQIAGVPERHAVRVAGQLASGSVFLPPRPPPRRRRRGTGGAGRGGGYVTSNPPPSRGSIAKSPPASALRNARAGSASV